MATNKLKLRWEYCECGCKGHETLGRMNFWIYFDLKGNYFLHRGHGWTSPLIGKFGSFYMADKAAAAEARKLLNEMEDSFA